MRRYTATRPRASISGDLYGRSAFLGLRAVALPVMRFAAGGIIRLGFTLTRKVRPHPEPELADPRSISFAALAFAEAAELAKRRRRLATRSWAQAIVRSAACKRRSVRLGAIKMANTRASTFAQMPASLSISNV